MTDAKRPRHRSLFGVIVSAMGIALLAANTPAAAKPVFTTLYTFQSALDGYYPNSRMAIDGAGNLYGTTQYGGGGPCNKHYCGTVFELSPPAQAGGSWRKTILDAFPQPTKQGSFPTGVILGFDGKLYGMTQNDSRTETVFALDPAVNWKETVLLTFPGTTEGFAPAGSLFQNGAGTLFGVTARGGLGNGNVFKLAPPNAAGGSWKGQQLYAFGANPDGNEPVSGVVRDSSGNLYGTTIQGGDRSSRNCTITYEGCGIVYQLSPPAVAGGPWNETILRTFTGSTDGANPTGNLIRDPSGVLYGTTAFGGNPCAGAGCGVVFMLKPATTGGSWSYTVLHTFANGDGAEPFGGVVRGPKGALYGVTVGGGSRGLGTIFKLTPPATAGSAWTYTVLYNFTGGSDGSKPFAGLTMKNGVLYGTTIGRTDGYTFGKGNTVFSLKP